MLTRKRLHMAALSASVFATKVPAVIEFMALVVVAIPLYAMLVVGITIGWVASAAWLLLALLMSYDFSEERKESEVRDGET